MVIGSRHTPAWAKQTPNQQPDCDVRQQLVDNQVFGDYAREMATWLRDRVAAYELWNEPNSNCTFRWSPGPYQQQVLIPGFNRIRAAQPGALVFGAALSQAATWDDRLTTGPQHFLTVPVSGLDFHQYSTKTAVLDRMNNAANYRRCTNAAQPYCINTFWLSETGFGDDDPSGTQGADMNAVFKRCQTLGAACAHVFYFNAWDPMHDDGADAYYHSFALIRDDGTVKGKYCTIRSYLISQEPPLNPSVPAGC